MFTSYRLSRIPQDSKLQAWNAAEELFFNRYSHLKLGSLLIINETFGALSVALSHHSIASIKHSAMSSEAIHHNLSQNQRKVEGSADQEIRDRQFDSIIVYPAKSINYFLYLLEIAASHLSPNGSVYVPLMTKHTSKGQIDAMNSMFKEVTPGRAEKKARVIELRHPHKTLTLSKITEYEADILDIKLSNLPGCYSATSLDQGAREFIRHFNKLSLSSPVLDMGCGNGALSLALLQLNEDLKISLVDENSQALDSAKLNLSTFFPNAQTQFHHSNGLNSVPEQNYRLIVCNPPFHQENAITEAISIKLFKDLSQQLSPEGECWIIGNRHLHYKNKLQKIFNHVNIEADSPKFLIYKCRN
jgi:16S rRNA G1207 methylase RsmC